MVKSVRSLVVHDDSGLVVDSLNILLNLSHFWNRKMGNTWVTGLAESLRCGTYSIFAGITKGIFYLSTAAVLNRPGALSSAEVSRSQPTLAALI